MIDEWNLLRGVFPEAIVKIVTALICGSLLGIEREANEKPAGLRTIMLITVGATLYMIVSDLVTLTTEGPESITRVDPSRIASQVVSGIGFLGGGAIIQARGSVHGLTTAATIWVAAGIGLCIGVGFPLMGVGLTLVVLAVLVTLYPIRAWLSRQGETQTIEIELPNDSLILRRVKNILGSHDLPEENITLLDRTDEMLSLGVTYSSGRAGRQNLLEELATVEGVRGGALSRQRLSD